jgi:hypothetical protein
MGRCIKHDFDNIDVWYDCEKCLDESQDYCKHNNYSQSISPYLAPREGTDNGEWVKLNIGNWDFSCCRQKKNYRRRIKQNNKNYTHAQPVTLTPAYD